MRCEVEGCNGTATKAYGKGAGKAIAVCRRCYEELNGSPLPRVRDILKKGLRRFQRVAWSYTPGAREIARKLTVGQQAHADLRASLAPDPSVVLDRRLRDR